MSFLRSTLVVRGMVHSFVACNATLTHGFVPFSFDTCSELAQILIYIDDVNGAFLFDRPMRGEGITSEWRAITFFTEKNVDMASSSNSFLKQRGDMQFETVVMQLNTAVRELCYANGDERPIALKHLDQARKRVTGVWNALRLEGLSYPAHFPPEYIERVAVQFARVLDGYPCFEPRDLEVFEALPFVASRFGERLEAAKGGKRTSPMPRGASAPLIAKHIASHPDDTAEQVRIAVGCSKTTVVASQAWKKNQTILRESKQPKAPPQAVLLNDRVVNADGGDGMSQTRAHREQMQAIDDDIDNRDYRIGEFIKALPNATEEEIAAGAECSVEHVRLRDVELARLTAQQTADLKETPADDKKPRLNRKRV